jgi:hypothetical protein
MVVTTGRLKESPAEATASAATGEASASLGVALKVDDRPPAPAASGQAVDGQTLPARGRGD